MPTYGIEGNLVPDWDFDSPAAGPPNADWTHWVETENSVGGVATVEADNTIRRFGTYSLQLTITDNTDSAYVTSAAFIDITNTSHYVLRFSHYKVSGADTLDVVVKQYDVGDNDLADDIVVTPAGAAAWGVSQTAIQPTGIGGTDWHADCVKAKLIIRVDTTVANWRVDGVSLALCDGLPLCAFGTQLFYDGWAVAELTSISGPSMTADAIDVSSHDSADQFSEFAACVKHAGEVSFAGNFDATDTNGQIAFEGDLVSGDSQAVHIIFPAAIAEWRFTGYPTAFSTSEPYDGKIDVTGTLKVTGKPTLDDLAI